jgi:8-oxo-dGTP diphosphatase
MSRAKNKTKTTQEKRYVSCLVISHENKIVLQERDLHCNTYPGYIATFGGGIEKGETPIMALIRELKEELGANVNESEIICLGILEESEIGFRGYNYVYFWRDKSGTITGCYEGKARYFNDPVIAKQGKKIMNDVYYALDQSIAKKLIK